MYAYSKKYNAERVILAYPLPESFREEEVMSYYANEDDDTVIVDVEFIDLSQPDDVGFAGLREKIG